MTARCTWIMTAPVLVTFLLSGISILGFGPRSSDAGELTLQNIKAARKQAAHRKRRIVMDNDGNEPVYYIKEATAKALLDCRTTDLVGTQVDTIAYCTWSSGFGMFTHNTQVGQIFTCVEEGFSENKTKDFIAQGTDPLKIMVEFCRRNHIEVFWSMRMNDTHDAWNGWYSPYLMPRLKKEHPEYLVASKSKRSRVGGWTAVDYAHEEIRDLAVKYIEEVCRNYDIDGVVLDYFRHPVYFKAHAMGGVVSQRERDMLTDMMKRLRTMIDQIAVAKGRPILITVRIPDSVEYCKAMGIDIICWLEEGLIDLMAVSGYFRLNAWDKSVELGHKYGVGVLACLSESRMKDEAGRLRNTLACYRGRAMEAWSTGVDGIYTFNFFKPKSSLWREIGDPSAIRPLERMYCTGARGTKVIRHWMVNGERFLNRAPVSPEYPRLLKPTESALIDLRIGEDLRRVDNVSVTLELQFQSPIMLDRLVVKMNGVLLSKGITSGSWLRFTVDPENIKKDINQIHISWPAETRGGEQIILQDLILWVRPNR